LALWGNYWQPSPLTYDWKQVKTWWIELACV